jgi:hypothetical protein
MRDDFGNDAEEFMDLRPQPQNKQFSSALWNKYMMPLARKLMKQRKVVRLRAGFDSSNGKAYHVTVWTDRAYDYGCVFVIRPVSGGVKMTGRDLKSNEYFEGDKWDDVVDVVSKLEVSPDIMAHAR